MSERDGSASSPTDEDGGILQRLREDPSYRWLGTFVGASLGLWLAWVHWIGLVVGAALVAVPRRSLPRGLLAGCCFGGLAVVLNAGAIGATGAEALETYLRMGPAFWASVATALLAGAVGGLVQALD